MKSRAGSSSFVGLREKVRLGKEAHFDLSRFKVAVKYRASSPDLNTAALSPASKNNHQLIVFQMFYANQNGFYAPPSKLAHSRVSRVEFKLKFKFVQVKI